MLTAVLLLLTKTKEVFQTKKKQHLYVYWPFIYTTTVFYGPENANFCIFGNNAVIVPV